MDIYLAIKLTNISFKYGGFHNNLLNINCTLLRPSFCGKILRKHYYYHLSEQSNNK